jgi:pyruvate dehydrogenase E1 component
MDIRRDVDPTETQEWVDSLKAVSQHRGPERTNSLREQLIQQGRRDGVAIPRSFRRCLPKNIPQRPD